MILQRDGRAVIVALLRETGDARVLGNGDVWETYERMVGPDRKFPVPEWALPQQR